MVIQASTDPAVHYDLITDAWRYIFGENFHFGCFTSPEMGLDQATDGLVDALANLGEFSQDAIVLDVGCGVGNPAFHLHEKYGCTITGISTSQRGIEIAKMNSTAKGYADKVRFRIADGTNNGFPDQAFDIVWVLESSHLMKKKKLFRECFRVLREGGQLLLCDLMLKKRPSLMEHIDYFNQLQVSYLLGYLSMKKAFGRGKTETFDYYATEVGKAGFIGVQQVDVSAEVVPTIEHWRSNIFAHRDEILQSLTQRRITDFLAASDLLEDFFRDGVHGYGLIKAIKP